MLFPNFKLLIMETQPSQIGNKTCPFCNLEFSCVSAKNRHVKNIHNQQQDSGAKRSHIICPLCTENRLVCGTYNKLEIHLEVNHKIKLQVETHNFASRESYNQWFEEQKLETTYAVARINRYNDYVEKFYMCNSSSSLGKMQNVPLNIALLYKIFLISVEYGSKCSKRMEKAGGSIKMNGVCPSRVNIKIWQTGKLVYCIKSMYK